MHEDWGFNSAADGAARGPPCASNASVRLAI